MRQQKWFSRRAQERTSVYNIEPNFFFTSLKETNEHLRTLWCSGCILFECKDALAFISCVLVFDEIFYKMRNKHPRALWCSGSILALGASGPGFKPRRSPIFWNFFPCPMKRSFDVEDQNLGKHARSFDWPHCILKHF